MARQVAYACCLARQLARFDTQVLHLYNSPVRHCAVFFKVLPIDGSKARQQGASDSGCCACSWERASLEGATHSKLFRLPPNVLGPHEEFLCPVFGRLEGGKGLPPSHRQRPTLNLQASAGLKLCSLSSACTVTCKHVQHSYRATCSAHFEQLHGSDEAASSVLMLLDQHNIETLIDAKAKKHMRSLTQSCFNQRSLLLTALTTLSTWLAARAARST